MCVCVLVFVLVSKRDEGESSMSKRPAVHHSHVLSRPAPNTWQSSPPTHFSEVKAVFRKHRPTKETGTSGNKNLIAASKIVQNRRKLGKIAFPVFDTCMVTHPPTTPWKCNPVKIGANLACAVIPAIQEMVEDEDRICEADRS